MGTVRYTAPDPDGHSHGLDDHEGYVGQVFEDGTVHRGGLVAEVDRRTIAHRAACSCGWLGETTFARDAGADTAWPEWEQVPALDAEWRTHTDPLLEALAREHGVAEPSWAADPLEPIRTQTQEAGCRVAAAVRACEELPPDSPDVAVIRRWLTDAARLIGRAEVRSYPVRRRAGRLLLERMQARSVTLWARWRVIDEAGILVGIVVEDREWLGHDYGQTTFTVAHNPTGGEWAALWRSEGHPTPMVALAALVDHLERR